MTRRLGIIGCGQLGQMLGHAAQRLNLQVSFLSLDENPVVYGAGDVFAEDQVEQFLDQCDAVTVEREAIPEAILIAVEQAGKLAPSLDALKRLRNRDTQKALLDQLGIPTAPWQYVEKPEDLDGALAKLAGAGIRCKQALGGYDGGGQWRITEQRVPAIPASGFPLIAEREIDIEAELAIIVVRDAKGNVVHYPITENHMREGVLTWTFAPAPVNDASVEKMRDYSTRLVQAVDYVGVMAIEFFVSGGSLMVNEVAPRVHNTGHWTLNACDCDQFEQHLRAVAGLPLVQPKQSEPAAMCNLLGDQLPKAVPSAPVRMYVQSYGKVTRPGRKLGHLTLVAPTLDALRAAAQEVDTQC